MHDEITVDPLLAQPAREVGKCSFEDELAELTDRAGFFGDSDERVRVDSPARRMGPADQRLRTHGAARDRRVDGLVFDLEPTGGDAVAHPVGDHEKLVASDPRDFVVWAEGIDELPAACDQQFVADVWAEDLVDVAELVDVDEDRSDMRWGIALDAQRVSIRPVRRSQEARRNNSANSACASVTSWSRSATSPGPEVGSTLAVARSTI